MDTLIITPDRNTHGKKDYTGAFKPSADRFAKVVPGNHERLEIDVSMGMSTRKRQLFMALDKYQEDGCEFDSVAFFMHGWSAGIQCGLRLNDVPELIKKLTGGDIPLITGGYGPEELIVIPLFCCLTGSDPKAGRAAQKADGPGGDGGFADRMRDELCKAGSSYCKIFAHTTKGHTTRNPFVRTYVGDGSPVGGVDGQWAIRPPKRGRPSPHWSTWRNALWSKKGTSWSPKSKARMKTLLLDMQGGFSYRISPSQKPLKSDFRFFAPYMTSGQIINELK